MWCIEEVPTANFCVPNHGVFYCLGCPVNFYYGVKPFGAERKAPLTKVGVEKIKLGGNNLACRFAGLQVPT